MKCSTCPVHGDIICGKQMMATCSRRQPGRTGDEEGVVGIPSRMLLRLEQRIEVPEAAAHRG